MEQWAEFLYLELSQISSILPMRRNILVFSNRLDSILFQSILIQFSLEIFGDRITVYSSSMLQKSSLIHNQSYNFHYVFGNSRQANIAPNVPFNSSNGTSLPLFSPQRTRRLIDRYQVFLEEFLSFVFVFVFGDVLSINVLCERNVHRGWIQDAW